MTPSLRSCDSSLPVLFIVMWFYWARQTQLFMEEVRQQLLFPQIRSYLKLYTTIGLDKIARFNDMDEEQFSAQLVAMKHKLTQVSFRLAEFEGFRETEGFSGVHVMVVVSPRAILCVVLSVWWSSVTSIGVILTLCVLPLQVLLVLYSPCPLQQENAG